MKNKLEAYLNKTDRTFEKDELENGITAYVVEKIVIYYLTKNSLSLHSSLGTVNPEKREEIFTLINEYNQQSLLCKAVIDNDNSIRIIGNAIEVNENNIEVIANELFADIMSQRAYAVVGKILSKLA